MLGLVLLALLLLLLFGGLEVWVSEAFFIALVVVPVLALAGGVYTGRVAGAGTKAELRRSC